MKSALTPLLTDCSKLAVRSFPHRVLALGLMFFTLAFISACGGGGGGNTPTPSIIVSVSPSTASLQTERTQAFTATVTGTSTPTVTWSVETGGGGIDNNGLYTAPNTEGTYHVRATSTVDTSKFGEATVSVTAAPMGPTIASFTPASGPVGTRVTLTGTNLTGATAVRFNGITATSFTPVSATQVTATVPSGATTGTLAVTTPGGTATSSASFTVTVPTGKYLVVYDDALSTAWYLGGWGEVPTDVSAAAPVRGGKAIEVTFGPNTGWFGFCAGSRNESFFMNQFKTIEFDIYFKSGSTGVENLSFILTDGGIADSPTITSLIPGWLTMPNAQKYDTWHHVKVDLASIHPKQYPNFGRFILFNGGNGDVSQPHFYIDDLKLGWVPDTTPPVITFGSAILNLTGDQLALAYTTNEATIYQVEYGTSTSYGHTIQGGTSADNYTLAHAVTLPDLAPGTTIYYKITALDHPYPSTADVNMSTYTNSYVIPPKPVTPPILSGLTASQVDSCSAVVSWNTNRPCSGTLTYQKSGGTLMTRTFSNFAQSTSCSLDLLEPSSTYTVTVTAKDAFGNVSAPATIPVTTTATSTADVTVTIDPATTHSISPWVYGANVNGTPAPSRITLSRAGGNRWTAYNWENNASNAGSDWQYSSDALLGGGNTPGEAVRSFIADNTTKGWASLMTVQLQGYVAADKNGSVNINDPNRFASRFKQVVYRKGSAFTATPDTADANVYMDEYLWAIKSKFTSDIFAANAAVPTFVSLDNEPELWGDTHREIQTGIIAPDAFIQKTIEVTKALKDVAPEVVTFGPVHYGFNGIVNWQNTLQGTSATYWFTDKYLNDMKAASIAADKRLLDVYTFHWYSEAQSADGIRVGNLTSDTLTDDQVQAIVQSPRSLWDTNYKENSWIANYLNSPVYILPRLQAKIDSDWPGTKLAITEYNNGGGNHIAGAIAQADNLGIYGSQGLFAATFWPQGPTRFIFGGFQAFRGFDGATADFGDRSVQAVSSDVSKVSAYISEDTQVPGRVVMVLINRSTAPQRVALKGHPLAGIAYAYRITAESGRTQVAASQPVKPIPVGQVPVNGTSWMVMLPALSVTTVEVK